MRRTGIRLGTAFLAVLMVFFSAFTASAENTVRNPLAIDMLIVIENSNEMNVADSRENAGKIDPKGLRFDAAAALLWMCDTKYSRANYFLFNNDLYVYDAAGKPGSGNVKKVEPSQIDLYDISVASHANMRQRLIDELAGDQTKISSGHGVKPGVDIGKALSAAVEAQLLPQNESGNRKVIVLISSGRIPNNIREQSVEQAKQAKEKALQNGIDIYTVCLKDTSARDLMQSLATKRNNFQIAKDAEELAEIFRLFFADMIGSSSQNTLKPELVEGTSDTYEVMIPILNKSVLETNIIIPVHRDNTSASNIEADSIEVLFGNTVQGAPKVTSSSKKSGHFAMIKIVEPDETGMWKLRFKSKTDPSSIPFYMLYNYDISLKATATVNGNPAVTAYKSDRIKVESQFVDREGIPSTDAALYEVHDGDSDYEDWMTIRGFWELYRVNSDGEFSGDPVRKGDMTADQVRRVFSTEIDLTEGYGIPSGEYRLVVYAIGAGLDRSVEMPLTLKNHPPVASDAEHTITVNLTSGDPGKETWKVHTEDFPLKAGQIVTDEDGDQIEFSLVAEDGAPQDAAMELSPDGTIKYTTRVENEKVAAGKSVYRLYYNDHDEAGSGSVLVTLKIHSDVDAMLSTYEPELTIDGSNPAASGSHQFLKNSSVVFRIRLKDREQGIYAGNEIIAPLAAESKILIVNQETGENLAGNGQFAVNESGDALEYTVENTGNKAAEWEVTAKIGPFETLLETVAVPNDHDPEAVNSDPVEINTDGDRVPGFLRSVIGKDTDADADFRKFSVKDLFSDQDGDILVYSAPVFYAEGRDSEMDPEIIRLDPQGKEGGPDEQPAEYTILVSGKSTSPFNYIVRTRMQISATDGDGRTGTYEQAITVVDLYNKMLTFLIVFAAAAVLLVILILIIHQVRKPKFPMLNLTIREEPSLYESGSETLSPVKKPTNINAMGVDSDMAAKHNISMDLLQNVIVKPIRSKVSVGVVYRKPVGGHEVALDDVRMKPRKQYTWKIGQDISIRNVNGEGFIVVKLEDRSSDNAPDVIDNFGGDGDWTMGDPGHNAQGGKRRSRKVNRKAAPEEDSSGSSKDDFDF